MDRNPLILMSHLSVLLLHEILHVVFDTLTHLCIQEYYYIYMLLLYSFFSQSNNYKNVCLQTNPTLLVSFHSRAKAHKHQCRFFVANFTRLNYKQDIYPSALLKHIFMQVYTSEFKTQTCWNTALYPHS